MKLNLSKDHILQTDIGDVNDLKTIEQRAVELLSTVKSLLTSYKDRRKDKTDTFIECWAAYLATPEAQEHLRHTAMAQRVGDVQKDWRHKIADGKAYEIVETIVSYLMGATFPNKDWFDMVPTMPVPDEEYLAYIKIMKAFLDTKLGQAQFRQRWEEFLRQLVITGTSIISLPWRTETKKIKRNVKVKYGNEDVIKQETIEKVIRNAPDIVVEDMVDTFLDPDKNDPNEANLIRRMLKTKGEVVRLIDEGVYDLGETIDVKRCKLHSRGLSTERIMLNEFVGISGEDSWHPSDMIEVWEFWGTIELRDVELYDVVITFVDNTLLRVQTNPYWGGKPFVVGTYTPINNTPYGFGALEPILGAIHAKNIIGNNRLDNIELTVNPMWLMRNDGTIDPNDVYSEPGRIIPVADMGSLQPLGQDRSFTGISVNEETMLEQKIDKTTGTGAFVGSGAGRSGERVTATEVQAVRDAGGNRLSSIHAHIEDSSLVVFLQRAYQYAQQFVVDPEIVRVRGQYADEYWYSEVGIDQLAYDFNVTPMGSKHVADKEFELRQRTEWIATISSIPEMAQLVNWAEVAKDITKRFTGEEASRFINDAPPPPPMPPEAAPPPADPMMEAAMQAGGNPMAQAVAQNMAVDGGQGMMTALNQGLPQASPSALVPPDDMPM